MEHPGFFQREGPFALAAVAARIGADMPAQADPGRMLEDVRPLAEAGPQP